mmetsp:Transcript_64016/g.113870  ORF Transcript_64016/g.113870 Transcript_64016/m.113870 type:complete len:253 (-) Transcript_64016:258-1016(-)|eukprot:CAMPEP_0197638084 /NCGR_PEP_ID=MMETSP1338-20131121/13106_1 /TAXON_ID=43686 ORGANISM="Pelagodinium beii, Strain RCC1491" /NCGR_SAMPLE_ID=MMETSP1338 /ASSEMBLY_ACC=CAM_ASM_000754 /LENGTH=252 /DNA_ID=CAMNT_0043210601 /DNA_START=118 /DNA_END=876 /DNA_ORIENTATION=-
MQIALLAALLGQAAASANWDELQGKACMLGIAASSVPEAAAAQASLLDTTIEECKSACLNFTSCEAVALTNAVGGKFSCSFLQKVTPDSCADSLGHTSTYVLRSSFEDHKDTDCLLGIAAWTLPGGHEPAEMPTNLSSCQEKCAATAECDAVILRSGGCYLRRGVQAGKCHRSRGADLYVLVASRKEGALVQAWQVFSLDQTSPLLGAGAGLLVMGVAAAVVWRGWKQRRFRNTEEGMSLSLAEDSDVNDGI